MRKEKNNNRVETMGLAATLGPFVAFDSSSRVQMLSSHVAQALQPQVADIPRVMTGFERQLGDFTFNIKMPSNGIIVSIHKKYHTDFSSAAKIVNPLTTIIFRDQDTGIFDYVDVYEYHSMHPTFGCKFIINPIVNSLRAGHPILKDTILAYSPSIKEGGIYATGIESSVAYIALPGTIEDGYVVSETFCEKASPLEVSSSIVEWGRKAYPLNIYGTDTLYKPFPDIGDKIRDDGLVFALREYNDQFNAIDMSPRALREVDMIHDIRIYGLGGATVYNIQIESGVGESRNKPLTPRGMETQALRYINQTSDYYSGIKNTYNTIVRRDKGILSPRLQKLITRAIADKPNDPANYGGKGGNGIIRRTFKNVPIDEYRVAVHYSKRKKVSKGSKITDRHGG